MIQTSNMQTSQGGCLEGKPFPFGTSHHPLQGISLTRSPRQRRCVFSSSRNWSTRSFTLVAVRSSQFWNHRTESRSKFPKIQPSLALLCLAKIVKLRHVGAYTEVPPDASPLRLYCKYFSMAIGVLSSLDGYSREKAPISASEG